jgi:hypothetical protein
MSDLTTFNDLLSEYFEIGALPPNLQAKWKLTHRYKDKVSQELLDDLPVLRQLGKEMMTEQWKEILSKPSFMSGMLKEDFNWNKACYHQPINLGLEHGFTFAEPINLWPKSMKPGKLKTAVRAIPCLVYYFFTGRNMD